MSSTYRNEAITVNNSSLHGGLGQHGRLEPYFNTQNIHPITTLGGQGNAGVSDIMTPGSAAWDLSLFKTWMFADRYGATFRSDFFNAFNRANFTGLDTGVNDSNFGNLTGANAAREIQLSMAGVPSQSLSTPDEVALTSSSPPVA